MSNKSEVKNVLLGGWITAIAVIIATGQNLLKGAVLSQVKAAGDLVEDEDNTGDGDVEDITLGAKAKVGTYTLVCIEAAENGGKFNVINPSGGSCGVAVVGSDFASGEINLKVTAGEADYVVGDTFTIPVTGNGKYKLVSAAATDGTGTAEAVLMLDTNATAADASAKAWASGEFDQALLSVPEGETAAAYEQEMRQRNMLQIETVGGNY